jgi:SAM-dependent methyltransferase
MSQVPEEVRERNRAVWSSGNWDEVSNVIAAVGPLLLDAIGVGEGTRLLDIGAGSGGTIAIPAAKRGASVVASDFIDTWFDDGRRRAAEAGVEIEWVVGDAMDLPFEDASFDVVTSTFGHMFAPDQAAAAAELVRVCKPGGTIGFCAWRPEGNIGKFFQTVGSHMPPPPPGFVPPAAWGVEDHVRGLLEPLGVEVTCTPMDVAFEFPTADGLLHMQENNFGPVVTAKATLGEEKWPALREDMRKLFDEVNERDDGSYAAPMEYLQTIARKPA